MPVEDVGVRDTTAARAELLTEQEFQDIYRRLGRPVWAYLYRMTGNAADADDLVQDTFCRVLASPATPRDDHELRAYVFRVASNAAIDRWRREGRGTRRTEPVSEAIPAGDDLGAAVARRRDVAATLRQLKPRDRILVWLAYVEGSPHGEIAGTLGLKPSSVPVLLFRARKKLAALLRTRGLGPGER
jgi:RNA polymerase sigma-70 factor (ECF subfamily)